MSDNLMGDPLYKEGPSEPAIGAPALQELSIGVPETLTTEIPNAKVSDADKVASIFEAIGVVSIRPYVNKNVPNMGLEKYGHVIFPGTCQDEQVAAIERGGMVRYITGLDEFAPEVQLIEDEERKAAVIRNIRIIVADLEKRLGTNILNIEDPEFWNKVKTLRPDNQEFWEKISIRCSNDPIGLDPRKDPYDLIKLMVIEAGGFDMIAKSYEDAQARSTSPKWYLDKEANTAGTRTEYKKLRNKATSLLDDLYAKNPKKLMYVTKVVDPYSTRYKTSTPIDILYDQMDEYIQGNGAEQNKNRAAQFFISTATLDMETLKMKAMVKDASFYKIISPRPNGMLYHTKTSTMLGRNVSDVVEYLKNPMNEDMLTRIMSEVEPNWK